MTSHDDLRADFNRAAELVRQLTVVLDRLEHRLDDDDPMLYDRGDDEEPAAPSTRPHDGWHLTGRNQRPNNSPAGFASTDGRARQIPSRPGAQLPEGFRGGSTSGMGAAVLRGAAVPTSGGVR